MAGRQQDLFEAAPQWSEALRTAGISSAGQVFTHPDIKVWRSIRERENGTLDSTTSDGRNLRFHVKRFNSTGSRDQPAQAEVAGWKALTAANIPTLELAAWGESADGRSFTIAVDLAGYRSGQQLLASGTLLADITPQTATLAAGLHNAGLHHRDLYLCHFFLRATDLTDCRLIDVGRVGRLPSFFARRWIVKDLAQFFYSTREFAASDTDIANWWQTYALHRNLGHAGSSLLSAVRRKADQIARHDARLKHSQPTRNVSLPTTTQERP